MWVKIMPGMSETASLTMPASKSLSHRYLLAAALAPGKSTLFHVADNQDVQATKACLRHLGAVIEENGSVLNVWGRYPLRHDGARLDCGESGSTLRFLIPSAAFCENPVHFTGHGRLLQRPLDVYRRAGAFQCRVEDREIIVSGPLRAGSYTVDGAISSQFLTGLLFALPLASGDSRLVIRPPLVSKPYLDMTLSVLNECGVVVETEGNGLSVPGKQHFRPFTKRVEGDMSAAAFFAALAVLSRSTIFLQNLCPHSMQGDAVLFSILEKAGADVKKNPFQVSGKIRALGKVDLADCPDLGPILFVLASQCETETVFLHTNRLHWKESDRLRGMQEALERLGIAMDIGDDRAVVHPGRLRGNVCLDGHGDHRIVMALAIAAVCADGPVLINGYEAAAKSYPLFFEDLKRCGVRMEMEDKQ